MNSVIKPDNRARFKQWLERGEARLLPLAFPQRELWETSPVPIGDPANHICGFIEIRGSLTFEDAESAVRRVVDRQEAMRISFLPGREAAVQMVRTSGAAVVTFRELTAAESRPDAIEEVMKETFRVPFDMVQGPLHRVEMMRRGVDDHVLAFSIHHAIADGWSLGVFVQDLCTAYVMGLSGMRKALAVGMMGLPDSLPPVGESYVNWAAAERARWHADEMARAAGFWKPRLDGARQLWNRGARSEAGPLHRSVSAVPAPLTKAVRNLAMMQSTTLFSTLWTAFQVALAKWAGTDDFVAGTPVANRGRESIRQTMGYFAGVVPLRGQVDPSRKFSDHVRAVDGETMDAFAHAMPFAELARTLGEPGADGAHALFDVRFALQNHPSPDVVLPRISTRLRMRSTGTARFDLGCEITEIGSELEVVWLFREGMVSESEITVLNQVFQTVLTNACRNPECRTAALTP